MTDSVSIRHQKLSKEEWPVKEIREWQTRYPEKCRDWCDRSQEMLENEYEPPSPSSKAVTCPHCRRRFEPECRKTGWMMASGVRYHFQPNLWSVHPTWGSIIADGSSFMVAQVWKMGSLLRPNLFFCDFCLVHFVRNGALRVIFLQDDVLIDEKTYDLIH